jgi:hypothetical protein
VAYIEFRRLTPAPGAERRVPLLERMIRIGETRAMPVGVPSTPM